MKRLQNLLGGCVLLFLFSVIEGRASSSFYEEEHDFVFPERAQLWQRVLAVTEAERDWIHEANEFTDFFCEYPHQLLFYPPNEDEKSLFTERLDSEHWLFIKINRLLETLKLSPEVTSSFSQPLLNNVIKSYEDFKDKLICRDNNAKKELLESKVFLIGEDGVYYLISQEMARTLVSKNKYGFQEKKNLTGMRPVSSAGGVHFKCFEEALDPPRPGQEFMAYALAKSLTEEELMTPTLLLKLEGVSLLSPSEEGFPGELINAIRNGKTIEEALVDLQLSSSTEWQKHTHPKDHTFFVQASRTIGRHDLSQHLAENPFLPVDPLNLNWHLFLSLLLAPGDGKADNYSVDDEHGIARILGIDNDKIFYPALVQTGNNIYAGINCIFYAWQHVMEQALITEVLDRIRNTEGTVMLLNWLGVLHKQKQIYQRLLSKNRLLQEEYEYLALDLPLVPQLTNKLYTKWRAIQNILTDHPQTTHYQFLKRFYPHLAAYYNELWNIYPNDPLAVMHVIYKGIDEHGNLKTAETFLETLDLEQIENHRVNFFTQPLNKAFTEFINQIPFEDLAPEVQRDILESLCLYFPQDLSTLFKEVPPILWHTMVTTGASDEILWVLYDLIPQHINAMDKTGKTPLDEALDYLLETKDGRPFATLIVMGAYNMSSSALKAYHWIQQKNKKDISQAFKDLQRRNQRVNWAVTLEELFPPYKGQGEFITSASRGQRSLLPEIQEQLEDPERRMPFGRRKVIRVDYHGQTAYLKFLPELPGLEEAIGEFARQTIGFGAPHGDLFRWFDDTPVWISQGIEGDNLHQVLKDNPEKLESLDPVSTAQMILMAMLVNPEDGKPDNYIISPLPDNENRYRLECIDNDHGFVPAFVRENPKTEGIFNKKIVPIAQVKTVLYCLPHMMQPIQEVVKNHFLNLDIDHLLGDWLTRLFHRNQKYQALYEEFDIVKSLLEENESFIGIPFQKGAIAHLYSKFLKLQDIIALPHITPLMILANLEPRLAKRYAPALSENISIKERFDKVDSGFYEKNNSKYITVSRTGTIMESLEIPFKTETLEFIRNLEDLGPAQALGELEAVQKQKDLENLSFSEILLDKTLEKALKSFDFSSYNSREIRHLLEPVYARGLSVLTIKNAGGLSAEDFLNKVIFEKLTYLDLRNASIIDSTIVAPLAKKAYFLERLNLARCTNIKWIAQGLLFGYDYLTFSNLKCLNVTGCSSLRAIQIIAPQLSKIWAEECPSVDILMIQNAPLTTPELYELMETLSIPTTIDFSGCNGSIDMEWHKLGVLASKGDAVAQYNFALMYEFGVHVQQDFKRALGIYLYCSSQYNYGPAYSRVGNIYEKGLGVAQNYEKAAIYHTVAANLGVVHSQGALGYLYENGFGLAQSYEEATRLYLSAASKGDATAQNNLAQMYETGDHITQNYEEAKRLYILSAQQGNAVAKINLMRMALEILPSNRREAYRLLEIGTGICTNNL
jgi:hypothetical protein